MFTGIIESVGKIVSIETEGSNYHFEIESDISSGLKEDQSVSHNGVCLTVVGVKKDLHRVTAVRETLKKSNFKFLKPGDKVNLERSMPADGRFDGHIVQGHIDQVVECKKISNQEGSWLMEFEFQPIDGNYIIEKGSVCLNGISLTCFDVSDNAFAVVIIPYTYQHTNFNGMKPGDLVNIEFDIVGKYIAKIQSGK